MVEPFFCNEDIDGDITGILKTNRAADSGGSGGGCVRFNTVSAYNSLMLEPAIRNESIFVRHFTGRNAQLFTLQNARPHEQKNARANRTNVSIVKPEKIGCAM